MEHTKGPWRISATGLSIETDDKRHAVTVAYTNVEIREQPANARLIAAAPDLLAALTAYISLCGNTAYMVDREGLMQAWDLARAAIAKAEGTA